MHVLNGRVIGLTWVVGLLWTGLASAAVTPPETPDVLAGVKLEPGKTAKVIDPLTGGNGYWQVYLPQDYTPSHLWPIIYSYHGSNGEPTVGPFKDLTDGKGFIIIGMEYLDRAAGGTRDKDLPNLKRIHDVLAKHVALHDQVQFIGGFSQGGWSTSKLAEENPETWAGMIILGAGRGSSMPDPKVKGKPIFIGIGEMDPSNAAAKSAAEFYKKHDANVTIEEFAGKAHAVDTADAVLREWLPMQASRAAGAVMKMKTDLAAAKAAEKAGKLGKALTLYQSVVKNGGEEAGPAQARVDAISQSADKAMADAEQAITAKRYVDATKLLVAGGATYAGSPAGDKFTTRLEAIRTDPAIKAQVEQARADAGADADEAMARTAEKQGDYKRAINLYEHYLAAFPNGRHVTEIRDHLAALKSDKSIQAGIASRNVDEQCKSWLGMAENYIHSGFPEKARPLLQKIVSDYPDTPYAAKAKNELSDLK